MKKMKIIFLCALFSFSVIGCADHNQEKAGTAENTQQEEVEEITVEDPFAEE